MKTWEDPSPDKNRNQHWQNFPKWQNAPRKTDVNVVKICQNQQQQNHFYAQSFGAKTEFCHWLENISQVIVHLSWCASLAIMLYVIRHAVNAKSVENYFPFRWVKIHFIYIKTKKNNNMTRFSTFPVRSSHSCKSKAYWLHCPQTGNPLMSPGLAALKNTFPQTICICKEKINISV